MERHCVFEVVEARLAAVLVSRGHRAHDRLLPPLVLSLPAERRERSARDPAFLAFVGLARGGPQRA
eukprot:4060590-Prymnesium_polylepis.1